MAAHTVVVSVLGLSRFDGESFSSHQGLGKSCLCYRFLYPGHDEYIEDHRSLLAQYEFEGDVVHRDSFLYWGSTIKTYDAKGSSQKVQFEILEHTVFYQDITEEPFKAKKDIWTFDGYIKAVISNGTLESPGKVSYKNRDLICEPQEYKSVVFPSGRIGKHPRGFVLVIDVSDSGPKFDLRLRTTEKMVIQLTKRKLKFVVAATKREEAFSTSLEKINEVSRKRNFTLIECSAKSNVNVSETFEMIAAKVLGKRAPFLPTYILSYHESAEKTLTSRSSMRRQFVTYLQKRVVQSSVRVKAIECTEEYKACTSMHGMFETDKVFAEHVLLVRDKELDSCVGAKNLAVDLSLRQKFLEDYLAERTDLSLYSKHLKDLILKICKKHSDNNPSVYAPLVCPSMDPASPMEMDLAMNPSCAPTPQSECIVETFPNSTQLAGEGNGNLHEGNGDATLLQDEDSDGQHAYTPICDSFEYEGRGEENKEYMYITCRPEDVVESISDSSGDEQIHDDIVSFSTKPTTEIAAMMTRPLVMHQQQQKEFWQPLSDTPPLLMPSNTPIDAAVLRHDDVQFPLGTAEVVWANKFRKECGHQDDLYEKTVDEEILYECVTNHPQTVIDGINGINDEIYNEITSLSPELATGIVLPPVLQQPHRNTSPSVEELKAPRSFAVLPGRVQYPEAASSKEVSDLESDKLEYGGSVDEDNRHDYEIGISEEYEDMTGCPQNEYEYMTGCSQNEEYVYIAGCSQSVLENWEDEEIYHEITSLSPVQEAGVATKQSQLESQKKQDQLVEPSKAPKDAAVDIDGVQVSVVTAEVVGGDMFTKHPGHQDQRTNGDEDDEYECMASSLWRVMESIDGSCCEDVKTDVTKYQCNENTSLAPGPATEVAAMVTMLTPAVNTSFKMSEC